MISDFVLDDGSWNVQKWQEFLPQWVVNIITQGRPPGGSGEDRFYWRNTSDGNFSVKAAYMLVSRQSNQRAQFPWMKVWTMPVPEKVKFLLWQAMHERLPTNLLRAQRGLSHSEQCPFQCQKVEDVLHVLRDCEFARNVWLYFIHPNARIMFFQTNLQGWLRDNISRNMGYLRFRKWPWLQIFGYVSWLLWKNRCLGVMEGTRLPERNIILNVIFHLQESGAGRGVMNQISTVDRWHPPPEKHVRLDIDGSSLFQGSAACGGVVRDSKGRWIVGFQRRLGFYPSTGAELMGILTGIQLCKQFQFQRVRVYTDSVEAYQLVMREGGNRHPFAPEIEHIRDLLFSGWDIELYYTSREAVRCADFLARDAQRLLGGLVLLPMVHPGCIQLLRDDILCNPIV